MTDQATIVERLLDIFDNEVRPYVEMDGGRIEFVRYEEGIVYVRLSGACVGCPSSPVTLKGGVERTIRMHIPEVRGVELAR
jgi:Fe-S cluster biogenesis protein NfuA